MKLLQLVCLFLISSASALTLNADNQLRFEKSEENKQMALMFFEKLLADPEALKSMLHKDFTFTYMEKFQTP